MYWDRDSSVFTILSSSGEQFTEGTKDRDSSVFTILSSTRQSGIISSAIEIVLFLQYSQATLLTLNRKRMIEIVLFLQYSQAPLLQQERRDGIEIVLFLQYSQAIS